MDAVERNRPDGTHHLGLLVAHFRGVEPGRWFHGYQGQQLQDMVLDHVPCQSGLFVVGATVLNPQVLRYRDLNVLNVAVIPERLIDAVGKSKHNQVLHRLLAQVVVDAVDLLFLKDALDGPVQFPRALEIASERLLDNQARPACLRILGLGQARSPQVLDHDGKETRRGRKVKQPVAGSAAFTVELFK